MFCVVDLLQDNFFIITESFHGAIYQFDMASKYVWRAPFSQGTHKTSLAYDPTYMKIYWTSYYDTAIRRANLTGVDDGTFHNLRISMCAVQVL